MAKPPRPAGDSCCRPTDCVERPLRRLFAALGSGVAAQPWPFVLVPLLLAGGLGAGFLFLPQRQADDIEGQFTPTGGPAKAERDFVRRRFPTDDAERFSAPRLPTEGAYAALIAVAAEGGSVLGPAARRDVLRLDSAMRARGYEQLPGRRAGRRADGGRRAGAVGAGPEADVLPAGGRPGGGGGEPAVAGELPAGRPGGAGGHGPRLHSGVGVDDMFIMIACWEQSSRRKEKSNVKSLLAETYAEAALSVTITTLTDVLAFFVGTWTAFPSVRSFCLYTGTAFVFCYIYTMTFFGGIIVLNHKREQGNRHWLTCMPVGLDEDQAEKSCWYNVCCIGNCSRQSPQPEGEHPMSIFFRKYYGPFFTNKWVKLLVVLLYGAYLGGSIYGCTQIREGIDLRNLASDDSYVVPYYDDDSKYFSAYGPRVMVVITESVDYWNETVRLGIENCTEKLESISYVDKNYSESWLRVYTSSPQNGSIDINNKTIFISHLSELFRNVPSFEWDVNKTQDKIEASRFFIQTVNVTSAVDEKNLLNELRETARQCSIPLMVYHPAFIYYDQYLVIVQNTVQNVVVAAGAMLVVSLWLIPNPLCCLWVTFAIASVIVGVAGFMTFWSVNLDSISMINLVICIGFSVDFSAHISYAFVTSTESSANKRAVEVLSLLGYPVLQGAVSTILGVVVLAAAKTYIFRTFFKIMFLVILFGALHGLVFIPVFLTFFGNCGRSPHTTKSKNLELRFRNDKDCP
ncbi:patched domain-containing protein 3 isoform X2 [Strix aluco]|uniref:patched domain-containing protein 3 isoform X2 n=1 Tax=Strix aluco TaxID=111821 RepID=UPI003DA1F563